MLVILIGLSVLLVAVAVGLYRVHPAAVAAAIGLCAAGSSALLSQFSAMPLMASPALLVAWAVCRRQGARRRTFAGRAALSVAAAWAVTLGPFVPRWIELRRLAADHPVVRIDGRLAYERRPALARREAPPAPDAEDEIAASADSAYEGANERYWSLVALEELHDDFFEAFAARDGFGNERIRLDPPRREDIDLPEIVPLSLPAAVPGSMSAGDAANVPLEDLTAASTFHRDQVSNFSNPSGFGYPLDGRHAYGTQNRPATKVRGFQPHAFRELPEGSPLGDEWQLARLELVSLLKHDLPAVYVSEHLPRMEELASAAAPTRPLDGFETKALARLLAGETVAAERGRNRASMFGGLRASARCTQCHAVGEGHLLGAFRYEFRRKTPLPPDQEPPPKPVT